jgi:hypothetical protein
MNFYSCIFSFLLLLKGVTELPIQQQTTEVIVK